MLFCSFQLRQRKNHWNYAHVMKATCTFISFPHFLYCSNILDINPAFEIFIVSVLKTIDPLGANTIFNEYDYNNNIHS